AAIGLWPHTEVKATAAAPDTRTNNQRAFDDAFETYDYDDEVKGAAALSEIEALGADLEASDPRHIDLAMLKALALPVRDRLPQFELLIKEQRNGMSYDVALIAGMFIEAATQNHAKIPVAEQIASLRVALERVSQLWPANVQAMAPYRLQLAEMLAK